METYETSEINSGFRSVAVHTLLGLSAILCAPTIAQACPDYTQWGETYDAPYGDGDYLSLPVIAGGEHEIEFCSGPRQIGAYGWTASTPNFTIIGYRPRRGEAVTFEVSGSCDTILVVNTGAGNWYFDDDDGPGDGSRIHLTRPSSGTYDVWVGTFGSSHCEASLVVRTDGGDYRGVSF